MSRKNHFVVPTSLGTEPALMAELKALGLQKLVVDRGAVRFEGRLRDGYRALLWTRIGSRVLLRLDRFDARDADELYHGVRAMDWAGHMRADATFAIDFTGRSPALHHSGYSAMVTKDAIVDAIRESRGFRPDVDLQDPDLRINVHLRHGVATVSVDLAGRPLHERGWGRQAGAAPLKETLAATLLYLAGWPELAKRGAPLVDPMCGSGTLLTEAAGIALQQAPGLHRDRWGFDGWAHHDEEAWRAQVGRARAIADEPPELPPIRGADIDGRAVGLAKSNLERAGLSQHARVAHAHALEVPASKFALAESPRGLFITNPPYGERLGNAEEVEQLISELGDRLRHAWLGWRVGVILPGKGHGLGLRPDRRHVLFNGPLECRFLTLSISEEAPTVRGGPGWRSGPAAPSQEDSPESAAPADPVDPVPPSDDVPDVYEPATAELEPTRPTDEVPDVYDPPDLA